MASLVPGLNPQAPPAFTSPSSSPVGITLAALRGRLGRTGRLLQTNRWQDWGDEDLPSYGKSEAEVRELTSYDVGFLVGLASLQPREMRQRQCQDCDAAAHTGSNAASYEAASEVGPAASSLGLTSYAKRARWPHLDGPRGAGVVRWREQPRAVCQRRDHAWLTGPAEGRS